MRASVPTALLTVLLLTLLLQPQVAQAEPGTDPASWDCSAATLGLEEVNIELAPVSPDEHEESGAPITPQPGRDDSWVPVILVHGWTAHATHPNTDGTADTQGTFSSLIDLWARPGEGQQNVPRSLVGQLQGIPGAAVFTYDYHPYSGRWVTDDHIGPGLGRTIRCLGEASGKQVIVVGHSMGGLALRQALADASVADQVAVGITIGTPHDGSVAAAVLAGVGTAAQIATLAGGNWTAGAVSTMSMLLSACGEASTVSFQSGTLCDTLAPPVRAFDGEAGRALRTGSREIRDLPAMPNGVPFHPLAGRSNVDIPGEGWFFLPGPRRTFNLGDVVVGSESALPSGVTDAHFEINCAYRLTGALGPHDDVRLLLGILGPEDATQEPSELFQGACFHSSLTRNIEITNEVLLLTRQHIEPQTSAGWRVEDALLPPGSCTAWAGEEQWIQLRDGQGEAVNESGDYGGISVLSTELLGIADVNGDGTEELIVTLMCTGHEIKQCCAGRTGMMASVAAFRVESGELKLAARGFMGGESLPGNEHGPATRGIRSAELQGTTLVTTEYLPYSHLYTPQQVGHDPEDEVTARYRVSGGEWVPAP